MNITVVIWFDNEVVGKYSYEPHETVPLPTVGESVVNPLTDGLVIKVERRVFEYQLHSIRVSLFCS
jgi:hypothetical protein